MPARKLQTLEEYVEAVKISTIAFVGTFDEEKKIDDIKKEMEDSDGSAEFWGSFTEDGVMTSHMINNIYHILYDGRIVLCGGVGNVSSYPEYRRKGGIREIFREKFADMRTRGFVFSALYPFSHEYYRKFGYEYAFGPMKQRFEIKDLASFACPYDVRLHKWGECIQPFKDVYQKFILGQNMAIVRSERQWDWIEGDAWKDRVYRYLLADKTGTHAYVVIKPEGSGEERKAVIRDIAWDSKEAFYGILGFLYRLSAQYKYAEGVFPASIDMRTLIAEPYHVNQEINFHGMFRVVDVKKALRLMRHPQGKGSYTICVNDEFLPDNSGTYAVIYENGSAVSVERTVERADLSCDVTTLAQLVLGFAPLSTLRMRPDVVVDGKEEILNAVPKRW